MHNRGRRRIGRTRVRTKTDPVKIGDALQSLLPNLPIKEKLKEYRVISLWPKVVGEAIARRTEPTALLNKKLYVNVSSQTWVAELTYNKHEMIERLNREAGAEDITDIVLRLGSVDKGRFTKKKTSSKGSASKAADLDRILSKEELNEIDDTVRRVADTELRELIRRTIIKGRQARVSN